MIKISNLSICILICILITAAAPAYTLDLTDIDTKLTDIFYSTVDSNEGTTSFRSLNIPSGGRAESLGTAYTGLADDISFFDYNPAASSVLKNTEVAVFHNSWISDSALETIAATTRSGNLGMGAEIKCFYVPFTEYNVFGDRVAGSYYSETTATLNLSYNFLAGYNFKGLAIGINIKSGWRSVPDYTDNDTNQIISGSGLAQSAAAFMGDIGMLVRFNFAKYYASRDPNFHIGAALTNAGAAITGFGSAGGITVDDPLPTKVTAGISYQITRPLTFSLDFRQPLNLQTVSKSGKWSAGTGMSVQLTDFFAVLGGFLLQGGNPRISLGSEFEVFKVKMNVNYTFDLTTSVNPVNHISLSAKINLGDKGRQQTNDMVDSYYRQGLDYYAHGQLDKAIETWEQALAINKRFDPAIEGIRTARKSQELYQRLLKIQSLD
jgi:hypothetical protein